MTRGHIAARMLRPLAWHHMDLRGRLMWLAMLVTLATLSLNGYQRLSTHLMTLPR